MEIKWNPEMMFIDPPELFLRSGRTPRQDDGQKSYSTHRKASSSSGGYGEEAMRPPSRARSDYGKSPRVSSGRTPSQSPHHSVMMGDATPLHDEN